MSWLWITCSSSCPRKNPEAATDLICPQQSYNRLVNYSNKFAFVFSGLRKISLHITYIFLDLSQIGSPSLRAGNGNLSPRILDLRGGGRRKSGFNFGDWQIPWSTEPRWWYRVLRLTAWPTLVFTTWSTFHTFNETVYHVVQTSLPRDFYSSTPVIAKDWRSYEHCRESEE